MTNQRPLSRNIRRCRRTRSLPLAVLTRGLLLLALCALPFAVARAQSPSATLSGTVTDQNGAVVPGATVTVLNTSTALERQATTNDEGYFTIPLLPPGSYNLITRRDGFVAIEFKSIMLNVGDQKALGIKLKVGDVKETVQVTGETPLINESPAVGTIVDRHQVENMPLNGRSFQSLIALTPGVVLTATTAESKGQFSVNGQRTYSNYLTVDGVSANFGVTSASSNFSAFNGAQAALTAQGTTQALVSVDALQEFRIQTSNYAPEFGRSPGAQVQLLTRSGTNDFHGSAFDYLRNDVFDANDWFANANKTARPPLRQNDFGATFGGPILLPRFGEGGHQPGYNGRNRTFFFFSYEGLRLRQPQFVITSVPSLSTRQTAQAALQPLVNAFPKPNGPDLLSATGQLTGMAQFADSHSDPSTLDAVSVRVDHSFNSKVSVFGRYANAPSDTVARALSQLTTTSANTQTATISTTMLLAKNTINELRGNFSRLKASAIGTVDDFGGAVPPAESVLFPDFAPSSVAAVTIVVRIPNAPSSSYLTGNRGTNIQRQINLVDSIALTHGVHAMKFGIDYRRLSLIEAPLKYSQTLTFSTLPDIVAGKVSSLSLASLFTGGSPIPISINWSVYGQDTWRLSHRLTFTYGLRWEVNPAPHNSNGSDPFVIIGLDNPANFALAPAGTPIYPTRYNNFAPRFGAAYQLRQKRGRETVLRGGIGWFYDLGSNEATRGFLGFPFVASRSATSVPFPLSAAAIAPPTVSLTPPYNGSLSVNDPANFNLPYTMQWNAAVEQALGTNQTLTATYVGNLGRRFLRPQVYSKPNANFGSTVTVFRSDSTSDYDALQVQFQRRLSKALQVLASYTWAHAIDDWSVDLNNSFQPTRGNSNFDVRHNFAAATTYSFPTPKPKLARAVLGHWSVDGIVHAMSAAPLDLTAGTLVIGVEQIAIRPDVVSGVPFYLNDPTVAGGRRFNNAAFVKPPAGRQGTFGRNVMRGLPVSQFDVALRRQFSLTERVKLQFRGEAFNVFNHPNFSGFNVTVGSATLGVPTQMFGRALAGSSGGLSPLYQIGGPRSMQVSMRLSF